MSKNCYKLKMGWLVAGAGFLAVFSFVAIVRVFIGLEWLDDWAFGVAEVVRSPALTNIMRIVTMMGGTTGTLTIVVGTLIVPWVTWKTRLMILAATVGAAAASVCLKLVFAIERPEIVRFTEEVTRYSFPSNHATGSMAFYVIMVIVIWKYTKKTWVRRVLAGAIILPIMIGASRVYLGVHYFSDILAGWLLAAGVVMVIYWIFQLEWVVKLIETVEELVRKKIGLKCRDNSNRITKKR